MASIDLQEMRCLKDFEDYASSRLPNATWQYYSMGSEKESTVTDNIDEFKKYRFVPRILKNVPVEKDISVTVLGEKLSMPFGFAPTAYQKMAHPDGEIAAVKAASSMGTIYTLSTVSNTALEDVAQAAHAGSVLWMQIYIMKDRSVTEKMIRKAEASGFKALVLTVDTPVIGLQLKQQRVKFSLPHHLSVPNIEEAIPISLQDWKSLPIRLIGTFISDTISWKDVLWIRSISKLPLVLKGITSADDARIAVEHGVSGIWVSNHGGRQLDGIISSMDALERVVKELRGTNCEVYFDGGVRWGSDVLKALALGARFVFVGRPLLWGLAHSGEEGARKILEILRNELQLCMTLSGCRTLTEADTSLLFKSPASKI